MEFRKTFHLRIKFCYSKLSYGLYSQGIQLQTINAIGSMDEELLSNLLNTSAILSKILTSLYFFSCLNLALAPYIFTLFFTTMIANESMATLPSPECTGRRQEDRGASRFEADI